MTVFIANTITCFYVMLYICCLSLLIVKLINSLINLFITFRFFATGYIYFGEIKIWIMFELA